MGHDNNERGDNDNDNVSNLSDNNDNKKYCKNKRKNIKNHNNISKATTGLISPIPQRQTRLNTKKHTNKTDNTMTKKEHQQKQNNIVKTKSER